MEDVFQAGCLGLLKAVKNFDPSLGNKFVTYAYYLIRGEVQRLGEEHCRREKVLSEVLIRNKDGMIMESQEEIMDYMRYARGEGENEWTHSKDMDNKLLVEKLLNQVTPLQKKILVYRYFEDRSQQEIGDLINKSQVFVSREEKRARKKLLGMMVAEECLL